MNSTKFLLLNAHRMMYGTSNATDQRSANPQPIQTQLSCLLEGSSPSQRDQTRAQAIESLGLNGTEAVPVFDEATQTVSRSLAMPICILSVVDAKTQRFKSVVGLSSLGLMNQLAAARSIPRQESFGTQVVDSRKTFALEDATAHPAFSRSLLVQQYGIQSYLGVPLMTTEGCCIGTLAVMDLMPHSFSEQEVAFLELSARWCMSEFENRQAIAQLQQGTHPLQSVVKENVAPKASDEDILLAKINQVRFDLVIQLTQDLRNPLTSITGMVNMLSREIYGPLSEKQREYTKIVLDSSQQMLGMVDEIVEVGELKKGNYQLSLAAVDFEMIAQQAISALAPLSKQQDLQIKLTVEPGSRICNLDKRIIKQLIYHLVFSIVKMSAAGSTIRLHISRKDSGISLALWVSNPWLGEDLPQAVISWGQKSRALSLKTSSLPFNSAGADAFYQPDDSISSSVSSIEAPDTSRQELGLLLSRYLTEMHGGEAVVQGSSATGYRYNITLPSLEIPSQDSLTSTAKTR